LAIATEDVQLLAPHSFDESHQLQYQARQQQYRQQLQQQQQQQQQQLQQQHDFLSPEEQYLYAPQPPVLFAPPSPPQPPPRAESDYFPIFADAGKSYFRNNATERLDDQLGDLKSDISDLQKKILLSVEDVLLDNEPQMQRLNECISTLDVLLALATVSKSGRMVRPEIVPERVVAIKGGRHPLQELVVDTFIANDTYIDSAQNVGIITGPNSSGKSIYLKQVGLIVYLAMLGMFVPAERAVIGQCRGILTRISSVESLSTPLSAFTLDLAQMARLIASYSESTICLIDEFGKGTSPSDGISLLAAIIKHLTSPSNPKAKPLTLIATHFTEILHPRVLGNTVNALGSPCLLYQMLTMTRAQAASATKESSLRAGKALTLEEMDEEDDQTQTQTQPLQAEAREGDDESTSLFRLIPGVASDSLGIACALKAGLPQAVVARAREVKSLIAAKKIISPIGLSNNRIPADPSKRALLRAFLQRSKEDWAAAGDEAALAQLQDLIAM
jgi:DNA mismatch repair ATPase MutS